MNYKKEDLIDILQSVPGNPTIKISKDNVLGIVNHSKYDITDVTVNEDDDLLTIYWID